MMDRVTVLQIIGSAKADPEGGGASGVEALLRYLGRHFDRERYRIVIGYPAGGAFAQEFARLGYEVIPFRISGKQDIRALWRLYRLCREQDVDIIHVHSPIHAVFALGVAGLIGAAVFMSVHVSLFDRRFSRQRLVKQMLLYRIFGRLGTKAVVISRKAERDLVDRLRYRPERVSLIRNAVDRHSIEAAAGEGARIRRELGVDDAHLLVGAIGQIIPTKGHRYLIEAIPSVLARVPKARFLIVGEGPERRALEEQTRSAGVGEHVIFTGFRGDVGAILDAVDLVALPSLQEGVPNVALEAFLLGTPVVATAVGAVFEAVRDGETGLLVPPADPGRLADAIVTLLLDESMRGRLGGAGRELVMREFDVEKVVRAHEHLYAQAARAPRLDPRGRERILGTATRHQLTRAGARRSPVIEESGRGEGSPLAVTLLTTGARVGGTETMIMEYAQHLHRQGYDVRVRSLVEDGPVISLLRQEGIRADSVRMRGAYDVGGLVRLVARLRRERPDILHTFLFHANILGRIAGRFLRIPVVISSQRSIDDWRRLPHTLLDRWTAPWADLIISNSEAGRRRLLVRERLPAEKVITIHNGLDLSKYRLDGAARSVADSLGIDPTAPIVGMIANLLPSKGYDLFLRAASEVLTQVGHARFLVVGEGRLRTQLMGLASECGLEDKVLFLGYRRDIPELLSAMDVFVLSSRWEGLPVAVLEAMAMAKPVVATDVGGVSELVVDGETGILVPPGSSHELARGIVTLLRDPERARRMGERGRERVESEFRVDAMCRTTEQVYWSSIAEAEAISARLVAVD